MPARGVSFNTIFFSRGTIALKKKKTRQLRVASSGNLRSGDHMRRSITIYAVYIPRVCIIHHIRERMHRMCVCMCVYEFYRAGLRLVVFTVCHFL